MKQAPKKYTIWKKMFLSREKKKKKKNDHETKIRFSVFLSLK